MHWKCASGQYRPCAKSVLTECSNMADLIYLCTQISPHHNQAKLSFIIAERNNLKQISVCRTQVSAVKMSKILELIKNENWKRWRRRIHMQTIPCAQDCDRKWQKDVYGPWNIFFLNYSEIQVRDSKPFVYFCERAVDNYREWPVALFVAYESFFNGSSIWGKHGFVKLRPAASLQSYKIFFNICSFIWHFLEFLEFPIQKR